MSPPRRSPALKADLVQEVLLRCPPEDPARLIRAALVCKLWGRLVCSHGFRRRYRELHRRPPILGLVANLAEGNGIARFIPTTSFRPSHADRNDYRAHDSRHGRILLNRMPWGAVPPVPALSIWDPITDEQRELPPLPRRRNMQYWNAAVLCAGMAACDHLDCHRGPFIVVFVGMDIKETFAHVYSSELGAWSEATSAQHPDDNLDGAHPGVLVGNALYFLLHKGHSTVEFDLATRAISVIRLPRNCSYGPRIVLMTTQDGGLGCVEVEKRHKLHLWSMEAGPDPEGSRGWVLSRVIDLETSLPAVALSTSSVVLASMDNGVLLLWTDDGIYSMDPKRDSAVKVCNMTSRGPFYGVFAYLSFYTPGNITKGDLNSVSTEETRLLPPSATEHDNLDDSCVGVKPFSTNLEGQRPSNDPINLDEQEHTASSCVGFRKRQTRTSEDDLDKIAKPNDEFSIKNCIVILESIEELSDAEKAKAAGIFKCDQNREIFLSIKNPTVRLLWIKGQIAP